MKQKKKVQPKQPSPTRMGEDILALARRLLGEDEFLRLQEELSQPLRQALRLNLLKRVDPLQSMDPLKGADPLKTSSEGLIASLRQQYGWELEQVPFCENGWFVTSRGGSLGSSIEHKLGFYYIQDAASMLPVSLFDFNSLDRPLVLDMAASPGGKTTHLVDRTMDHGLVLANDSSADRISALRLVLQNWGAINMGVTRFPGEQFGNWFPELFDRVLLDAPCSMQNLRSTENHPIRAISEGEQKRLSQRQLSLLESAVKSVRVGGQVVYSTCTLSPLEDEGVVDALLQRYGDSLEVIDVSAKISQAVGGIRSDGQVEYLPQVARSVRLWPHSFHTSGFFAVLLFKKQSIPTQLQPHPDRPFGKTGLKALSLSEAAVIYRFFQREYGLNLEDILEGQNSHLFQRNLTIFALPDLWMEHFAGLPFQSIGLEVGEWIANTLVPSHELVARFAYLFRNGAVQISSEQRPAWLRGEDLHQGFDQTGSSGRIVAVFDEAGHLLGRGKILKERLRNLLPRRLVC